MSASPAPRGDPGLFGPDSVTWRVHADPMLAIGGLRALLLQAVHPLAMAGVAQFSGYQRDPWGRFLRTANYVGETTFGTAETARRAGAQVRAVHRPLAGVEPESGRPYRVSDPHLLRWVHVCESESFLSTYRRSGGPLAGGDGDRYYDEMQRSAALVGLSDVPRSEAAVAAYVQAMRPELRVTAAAREAARMVINPPMPWWVALGTPAKPAWWALGGLAFALLPRWARRLYSLPGLATTDLAATLAARGVRQALLAIPPGLREGPALKAARARLAAAD
jgi:uncharacterized protein (DUF2236 family)